MFKFISTSDIILNHVESLKHFLYITLIYLQSIYVTHFFILYILIINMLSLSTYVYEIFYLFTYFIDHNLRENEYLNYVIKF